MTFHELLKQHWRAIGLGFALTFLSSFGQTFFISLSGPDIREAFGLTHGGFSLIYSAATLVSGILMIWIGSVIDRVSIRFYATVALLGLTTAAISLSFASNLVMLGLSLFFLRLCGQGMLGHAGVMSTARLPAGIRGRAVGVATLGFSGGEAVLPGIAVALIAVLGWTGTWRTAALVAITCLGIGWLLGFALKPRPANMSEATDGDQIREPGPRWIDTLRDWRFVALIPTMVGYPAIMTAYLFHQRFIAEAKGWPVELLATGITLFALVSVAVTMTAGALVDRFGAVRLSHFYLLGMILASFTLVTLDGPFVPLLFFGLIGLTTGCTNVVIAAVLAEIYGTKHLGKIRALAGAIMVIASAIGPVIAGPLFDIGVGIDVVALGFAAYMIAAAAITFTLPNPRAEPLRPSEGSAR
ncbi:MFS transporter [Microvirga rosea]|uniref:MFS transporter n=1 Tax=Microvirga rosea TaxID=2715425 RepID=UPI001D0A940C|nr:MFS transporter [Microvirga rosea]MCB8822451.1 MFS transporter [Microvirga rosea]